MDMRERILHEARELLRKEGLNGFSMRGVAERVGVSATALYRHYQDKDALLSALLEQGFSTFSSYLMRSLTAKTPMERLRAAGRSYFAFALEHPRDYALMFMTPCEDLGLDRVSEGTRSRMEGTFVFLVDRVKECMAAGVAAPLDPQEVALNIWAEVHGLTCLRLNGQLVPMDDRTFDQRIAFMLDRIEASLRPAP